MKTARADHVHAHVRAPLLVDGFHALLPAVGDVVAAPGDVVVVAPGDFVAAVEIAGYAPLEVHLEAVGSLEPQKKGTGGQSQ